jgi:hypothetical protein
VTTTTGPERAAAHFLHSRENLFARFDVLSVEGSFDGSPVIDR